MDEEDGSQHHTDMHVIGAKHVKVMTWFYYKDKYTKQITSKNTVSPMNESVLIDT